MLADVQITIIPKYHATYGCRPLPTVELQFVCQDFTVTTRIANIQKKGGGGIYPAHSWLPSAADNWFY